MIRIPQLEELKQLLFKGNDLLILYSDKSPNFVTEVKTWLDKVEGALKHCRIAAASKIGVYKSELISSGRGLDNPSVKIRGRASARKMIDSTTLYVLQKSIDILYEIVQNEMDRISFAASKIRRALKLTDYLGMNYSNEKIKNDAKGLIEYLEKMRFTTEFPEEFVNQFGKEVLRETLTEIGKETADAIALVGKSDLTILIDQHLADLN